MTNYVQIHDNDNMPDCFFSMKLSGQVSFSIIFSLLSNTRPHFPIKFWICCCMPNKLCHIMITFAMFYWYEFLYYKEIPSFYWMKTKYCISEK